MRWLSASLANLILFGLASFATLLRWFNNQLHSPALLALPKVSGALIRPPKGCPPLSLPLIGQACSLPFGSRLQLSGAKIFEARRFAPGLTFRKAHIRGFKNLRSLRSYA